MRVLAWFSCGASSAVASKMAIEKYGPDVEVVYCDTMKDEHPDNERFLVDCERWLGRTITRISNPKYPSVDNVFMERRYMAGVGGALCTVEMKKIPRFGFQLPDDTHVFGLTADEGPRIERMERANPELTMDWVLREGGVTKRDCLAVLRRARIKLPAMYGLGYDHNNCIGCVKATSPKYWDSIRRDFPEVFEKRVKQSRELGVRLTRVGGKRVFIDEVPHDTQESFLDDMTCGPECGAP